MCPRVPTRAELSINVSTYRGKISRARSLVLMLDCYNKNIPTGTTRLTDSGVEDLRTTTLEEFHETIYYCFNKTTEEMLGRPVRDEIFRLLGKNRLAARDLGERFDDVVTILKNAFGESARIIVYRTVVGLYDEYSQRHEFTYSDMLRERIELLKAKVTSDILKPRHLYSKSDDLYLPRPMLHNG